MARNEAVAKAQRKKFAEVARRAMADGSTDAVEAEEIASTKSEDERQPRE